MRCGTKSQSQVKGPSVSKLEKLVMLGIYGGTAVLLSGVIVGTVVASPLLIAGKCAIVAAEALDERLRRRAVGANCYA